jgi:hypothetical protein
VILAIEKLGVMTVGIMTLITTTISLTTKKETRSMLMQHYGDQYNVTPHNTQHNNTV